MTATLTDELPAEVELRQAQHSCRAHLNDVWDSGAEG